MGQVYRATDTKLKRQVAIKILPSALAAEADTRQEGTSFTAELWVVPYPSGTPRRVLERADMADGSRMSWAPDSRHIVLSSVFLDRLGSHLYSSRSTFEAGRNEKSPI